jgi:CBS domain containing-hemolysin-like protein
MATSLIVALLLLLANGFFVAVEFALIASRRTKLEPLAEQGNNRAKVALGSMKHLNLQLAGAQLGVTMASLLLGFVAEPTIGHLLEEWFGDLGLPSGASATVSFVVALTFVAFLHMVIGEMVPKNIAIAAPETTMLALALPNRAYSTLLRPVLVVLNAMANAIVRLLGVEPRDELATSASAEELAMMLGASREEGLIEDVAHQLLTGALDLGDRSIATVMVPTAGVKWLPRSATVADAEAAVVATGHSRLVVADGHIDDVLGFFHAKDLLTIPAAARSRALPLSRIRRMPVLGPATSLDDALLAMQQSRVHVAVVTDADGHTAGIVTLEDVIEALVGDIRDESDL